MNYFINIEYFSMLDPPEQLNTNHFRSSHCPSNFIGWGYVAVHGMCLQAILVVREEFTPITFSTFTITRLLIILKKNTLN